MESTHLQLTSEQRAALAGHPGQPLYIEDAETGETYLLLKAGQFPELEEEYVRASLKTASLPSIGAKKSGTRNRLSTKVAACYAGAESRSGICSLNLVLAAMIIFPLLSAWSWMSPRRG